MTRSRRMPDRERAGSAHARPGRPIRLRGARSADADADLPEQTAGPAGEAGAAAGRRARALPGLGAAYPLPPRGPDAVGPSRDRRGDRRMSSGSPGGWSSCATPASCASPRCRRVCPWRTPAYASRSCCRWPRWARRRWPHWKADVDLGDFVFVRGRVISSKRGELSVLAAEWQLAAKALRPMPNLYAELSDETRVRQRYADLTVREAARDMVRTRATITRSLRETLHRGGLRRDRDAGAAAGARRRERAAVPHPPERVRHRHDAADRPGAVPQAGRGRRRRAGLRDRPDLPQRGHRLHPQRGVHHARGLPGLG